MAVTQISTGITIINSLLGYMGISITNQDTSAATAIATGSKVEVAGAFFTFGSDETPTGWTSITTATTGYIALTPSGTAGSQILSASWVTSGSVVWSDSKQGYYTSTSSNVRVVASAYKTSATQYDKKRVLIGKNENLFPYMSDSTIKGRASGAGTGDPTDLSVSDVSTMLKSSTVSIGAGSTPTISGNDLFDLLSPLIPNVVPFSGIPLFGSFVRNTDSNILVALNALRIDASTISINFINVTTVGLVQITATDGDATIQSLKLGTMYATR